MNTQKKNRHLTGKKGYEDHWREWETETTGSTEQVKGKRGEKLKIKRIKHQLVSNIVVLEKIATEAYRIKMRKAQKKCSYI